MRWVLVGGTSIGWRSSPPIRKMGLHQDPKLQPQQLAGLFPRCSGSGLSAEQQNFVRVLVENERLQVLPEIRDLFVALKNEHEGVKK